MPCTSIHIFNMFFCFYPIDGSPIMAAGSTSGHISFWDLEKKQSLITLEDAHIGGVTGMKFLIKQPSLITSGPDNSLKVSQVKGW